MPDFEQGEAQIAVMQSRLEWASVAGAGRRLDGVKLNFGTDEKEQYEKKDLPMINMLSWEETEEPFNGQRATSDLLEVNGSVVFGLHIHQRNLLVDYNNSSSRRSAFYYLNRVRDVIETDYDGSIDLKLEDTCRTGIETTATEVKLEGGASHHSFEIEILYKPHVVVRGTRTDSFTLRNIGTSA